MCLAIPAKIVEIGPPETGEAVVEIAGIRRQASLALVPEAAIGDYVLLHAGYAIATVNQEEAQETLRILSEMAAAGEEEANG